LKTREETKSDDNSSGYVALYIFINKFLGIKENSGYDYWLMNVLSWYNITEHGGNLGVSWFYNDNSNIFKDRLVPQKKKERLIKWINAN